MAEPPSYPRKPRPNRSPRLRCGPQHRPPPCRRVPRIMETRDMADLPFRGWRVAWAAFIVAAFGWGVGFYGPPVFLFAVQESRGWSIALVSAAVTSHFLLGAVVVANLPKIHARFGLVLITRLGGCLAGLGVLGWALAAEPWQLFAATLVSGAGWAMTGGAAINAMVSPWFQRLRPAALGTAYNGASIGGVVFSPLWVALIGLLGFSGAAALIGVAMAMALWWIAGRYFAKGPAAFGQVPDGEAGPPPGARIEPIHAALPGRALWGNRRFATLALATSLGLFAQIGLIAHLVSLLAGPVGAQNAGFGAGLATVCAVIGRTGLGWLLSKGGDRRVAAAANSLVQVAGSLAFLASGGTDVPLLLLGIVLFGLGLGNATSLAPMIAQRDFSAADTGRVVALVTACSQAAYAFAPAAFGLLRGVEPGWFFGAAALIQVAAAVVILAGRRASYASASLTSGKTR
ncbi:MFS transporter [Plastoroseomonas arctica]|nr:MFS transporter [Plastoroseomonas arctica]